MMQQGQVYQNISESSGWNNGGYNPNIQQNFPHQYSQNQGQFGNNYGPVIQPNPYQPQLNPYQGHSNPYQTQTNPYQGPHNPYQQNFNGNQNINYVAQPKFYNQN